MKKTIYFFSLFLFLIVACKKKNDPAPSPSIGNCFIKTTTSAHGDTVYEKFTYSSTYTLLKYEQNLPGSFPYNIIFDHDNSGKLVKVKYYYVNDTSNFQYYDVVYNSKGQVVAKKLFEDKNSSGGPFENTFIDSLKYNLAGQLSQTKTYQKDSNVVVLQYIYSYQYDPNNNVKKITLDEIDHDTISSSGDFSYTYSNKHNPFLTILPYVYFMDYDIAFGQPNNVTVVDDAHYLEIKDETFNDSGYPLRRVVTGVNSTVFIYNYECR